MAEPRRPDVVVVVGGGPLHPGAVAGAAGAALVVAADSGVDHALAAGLPVGHVVGDLDSASPAALAAAEAAGARVHRHPADKDATDSELAIALARSLVGDGRDDRPHLLLVGGGADRLDHLLADVAQLTGPGTEDLEVTAVLGAATCTVVRAGRPRRLVGAAGAQVSLLTPVGRARGVTTSGLRWSLVDAELGAGTTRGVSNELVASEATVTCTSGVVLVVVPGTPASAVAPRSTAYDASPGRPTSR